MTVQRCLDYFKKEYAWSFRLQNTSFGDFYIKPGYTKEKDIYARRHAYTILRIHLFYSGLSIRQLKNLYSRILYWLDEMIDLYA